MVEAGDCTGVVRLAMRPVRERGLLIERPYHLLAKVGIRTDAIVDSLQSGPIPEALREREGLLAAHAIVGH